MELACEFPNMVRNSLGECVFQQSGTMISLEKFIGCLLMMSIAGLSSLAGLGGGGPNIVVLIIFFDMMPKDATIAVFASILGSSFGNMVNQMQTAFNNEPMIRYKYAFITLPLMFIGSLIGVLMNRLLPSVVIVAIIIAVASYSIPKIFQRYKDSHFRETEELIIREENERHSDLLKQTKINPFDDDINLKIFKQLGLMVLAYMVLALLRGSEKFPSILGTQSCGFIYWILELSMFAMAYSFWINNKKNLESWTAPTVTLGEKLFEYQDLIEQNKSDVMEKAVCAGIFSGFGLGGGIFLVPLYRSLKLNPLQATATCTFSIFITATINCLQAIFIGVLSPWQFLFYFAISGSGSYFLSVVISNFLRKAHRLSYIQLLLVILLVLANINLPISLYMKYVSSGHDLRVIFGFGNLC